MDLFSAAALLLAVFAAYHDIKRYRIPSVITSAGFIVYALRCVYMSAHGTTVSGLLLSFAASSLISLFICAAVLICEKVFVGGADLRLIFMLCLFFGWQLDIRALFASCIIAAVLFFFTGSGKPVPFAAALAAGWTCVCVFDIVF